MAAKSLARYHGQPPDNGLPTQCEASLVRDSVKTGRKAGDRCPRAPIAGGNVCTAHGAKAPQVRDSAAIRLAKLQSRGVDLVETAIALDLKRGRAALRAKKLDTQTDLRVGLSAANSVFDRTGLSAKQQMSVVMSAVDPKELSEEQLLSILALREQLGQRRPADKPSDPAALPVAANS